MSLGRCRMVVRRRAMSRRMSTRRAKLHSRWTVPRATDPSGVFEALRHHHPTIGFSRLHWVSGASRDPRERPRRAAHRSWVRAHTSTRTNGGASPDGPPGRLPPAVLQSVHLDSNPVWTHHTQRLLARFVGVPRTLPCCVAVLRTTPISAPLPSLMLAVVVVFGRIFDGRLDCVQPHRWDHDGPVHRQLRASVVEFLWSALVLFGP